MQASKPKVLIIEDIAIIRMGIIKALGEKEYQFLEAATIKQASMTLRSVKVDLIILDINLIDTTGFDTVKDIQKESDNIPIIVCSGSIDRNLAVRLFEAGVHDIISKPVDNMRLTCAAKGALSEDKSIIKKEPEKAKVSGDRESLFWDASSCKSQFDQLKQETLNRVNERIATNLAKKG